jgi:adenylate cyclase
VIYRFDPFSLDTDSLELQRDEEVVAVEPQVFSLLAYLIENRDRVIGKDELIEAVWDGRAISDGALNSRINAARRAVGDTGSAQAVIKTFTRRGFRFIGSVTEGAEPNGGAKPPALQAISATV